MTENNSSDSFYLAHGNPDTFPSKYQTMIYYKTPRRLLNLFLALLSIFTLITACTKSTDTPVNNTIDCSGAVKTFSGDITPIFQNFCISCHGNGSSNGPGSLVTHSQVFNARVAIRNAILTGTMPQNASLTPSQKNAIICWIDNGSPNN